MKYATFLKSYAHIPIFYDVRKKETSYEDKILSALSSFPTIELH